MMRVLGSRGRASDAVPPLTPDADEARDWAERELADPVYDIAEPTPFDRIARAIGDFFASLFNPEVSGAWGSTFALVAVVTLYPGWWWMVLAAFLAFDLSMVGYVRSPAAGAWRRSTPR